MLPMAQDMGSIQFRSQKYTIFRRGPALPTPGSSSQHAVILLIRESGGGVAGWLSSVDGVEGLRMALASWALESDALRV